MLSITKMISSYNNSANNNVQYIVLHDTGNWKDSAWGNAHYFNECNRGASAHYFVDDNNIYQVVEENRASWHCGDGGCRFGIGNHNSIGIEMCNSGGYISEATINNTLELVVNLMNKYGLDENHVVRHYDASRKRCPNNLSANGWAKWWELKVKLRSMINGTTTYSTDKKDGFWGTVTASCLNVRDANGNIIGHLNKGDSVKVNPTYSKDGWYSIYFGNYGGFVSMDYVDMGNANFYVVTQNLPYYSDYYKALDLSYILPYFTIPKKVYARSGSPMWIETEHLTDEQEISLKNKLGQLYYDTKDNGYGKFIRTDYLKQAYESYQGVDLTTLMPTFDGIQSYIISNAPNIWFETSYMTLRECIKLKEILGWWFYSVEK